MSKANKTDFVQNNKHKHNDRKESNGAGRYNGNRRIAICGVFIALAMILSYLESLVPLSFAVPGIKLGLANLVTIVSLMKLGLGSTVIISAGRIILSGILFGNPMVIIYSLAGAALSIVVMCVVKQLKIFTITGVSICGAVSHNAGQLMVAAFVLENTNILYYMTVLVISGTIAGAVIGIMAAYVLKNIRF